MRRFKVFMASLAVSALALVGLAPAAGAVAQIGTPSVGIVHLCINIPGVDPICINF